MKHISNILFSTKTMAALLFFAAFFMGFATFIENDYGANYANKTVYSAWWFELILVLLTINLLGSIFTRKLYAKKKFPIFLFHVAFSIMLIGAGLTRYIGFEGIMHIREGATTNLIQTNEEGLIINIKKGNELIHQSFVSKELNQLKNYKQDFSTEKQPISIEAINFQNQAYPQAMNSNNGKPTIGFVFSSNNYRGFNYIQYGQTQTIAGVKFSYSNTNSDADIWFNKSNDSLFINSSDPISVIKMMGDQSSEKASQSVSLQTRQLYKTMGINIVPQELYESANIMLHPAKSEQTNNSQPALQLRINYKDESYEQIVLNNNGYENNTSTLINDYNVSIAYGKRTVLLPFSLTLNDFHIDRYPGSHSPSSFSSFVTINHKNEAPEPFHIYMNNILKLEGFRFFQSSYDDDEQGTILSVNYDIWGTTVTYIGYFLLFLGIVLSLLSKNTFFRNTNKLIKPLLIVLTLGSFMGANKLSAKQKEPVLQAVSAEHAELFSKLLIQNPKGRTEPVATFASGIVRKVSRSESLYGLSPTQTFLELNMNGKEWSEIPIIKITHPELQNFLGRQSKYFAYTDFLDSHGQYKLQKLVNTAYNTAPSVRSKFDKAIIKADEKLNICYSIFSGQYLSIFPAQDSTISKWLTPNIAYTHASNKKDSIFLSDIMPTYYRTLAQAKEDGDYTQANELVNQITQYQQSNTQYSLPNENKITLELLYYKWNVFKKLFPLYATLGVIYLIILIVSIIRGITLPKWLKNAFTTITFIAFVAHTLGFAIRWYVSGHAPMSNGYESMIFISWVTILAGFIFNKQTSFALSATLVLASMTLMVANLSFMDPEITNLVPVLKSYWLTLHVSIITASYGFLGFGAILGIINQILFITKSKNNAQRINSTINELTITNHKTLIVGLYFLTIGTFLGAIWANESWGRYWGWDPKETWSLITIIIYVFVTHARLIPGIKGIFAFNILSLYGFASVLMTYFGVNYYLSGMHSYAGGDPVPVPTFVYYTIAILFSLSTLAWFRYFKTNQEKD